MCRFLKWDKNVWNVCRMEGASSRERREGETLCFPKTSRNLNQLHNVVGDEDDRRTLLPAVRIQDPLRRSTRAAGRRASPLYRNLLPANSRESRSRVNFHAINMLMSQPAECVILNDAARGHHFFDSSANHRGPSSASRSSDASRSPFVVFRIQLCWIRR